MWRDGQVLSLLPRLSTTAVVGTLRTSFGTARFTLHMVQLLLCIGYRALEAAPGSNVSYAAVMSRMRAYDRLIRRLQPSANQ